jgi:hypothetical protein
MQCNAMQCNRFRNWEDFPSYSSSSSSISNMQYIIQCNACAPEGRPTTQATTLDDLPPHQTRRFLQLPINGILPAKNNTSLSLSLHTLKNSVPAQPCACHATLFRTGLEPSKRTLRLSYSPPPTLIDRLHVLLEGTEIQSTRYIVLSHVVRYNTRTPQFAYRYASHNMLLVRPGVPCDLHESPRRSAACVMLHCFRMSRVVVVVLLSSLNRQNNANAATLNE